ncbi:MAG: TonB-dependent receptor [Acidobacteria bacterium]|nr:TonB-dependent receptor [Acidobacteriota bacterium]
MKRLVVSFSLLIFSLLGAVWTGRVVDPSGAPVPGARVTLAGRTGALGETTSDARGAFRIEAPGTRLIVTAPGFARHQRDLGPETQLEIRLELAPVHDAITVTGSAIPSPASEQAGSITVIPRGEVAGRNEAMALDLLRQVPGVAIAQTGQRGGQTSLFVRGGDSKFNLVLIDGVPVNDMRFGGLFDFAHIPTDQLDRIEVIRGPQSAVYGSNAISSVVNFVTRLEDSPLQASVLADGGSFATRRFAASAAGSARGLRASASASRLDTQGEAANADYRNENVSLNVGRRWSRQDLSFRGGFNSSENGVPGPYGSNPAGNFSGLDRVSRNKNNFSGYQLRYEADVSSRIRTELSGLFFLNNNYYTSPFVGSYNKDLRGVAESRTTVSVSPAYTLAFGAAWSREEVKNTFVSDNSFRSFPLRRDQEGFYAENRFQAGRRLFINAGVRAEIIRTPFIPGSTGSGRPDFAAGTIVQINPKLGAAYRLASGTRAHASFGTGIRPPGGFDLAFTNNPALKPERARSWDAGVEQRLGSRVALDATWFSNRYYDLIVSLGGSLSRLGSYRSDNLANSRARGAELSATYRPSGKLALSGSYTYLDSEILSLDGASGVAPRFFRVGQELIRRPRHSGALNSSFLHKRLAANVVAYFRGQTLDTEPNFGASAGLYPNPGYANLGANLNYDLGSGVTLYGNLHNGLNRHYEEVFGYPSPRLNFVAGLKWRLARER